MKREIIVVTAAYGQQQVNALGGQSALIPIIAAAGADGIEIRRELFCQPSPLPLDSLRQQIAQAGLHCWYSVPEALFDAQGALNAQLDQLIAEAEQLNAVGLKFSLGHYRPGSDCHALVNRLQRTSVKLVVENDQTACGRLQAMAAWCHHQGEQPLTSALTFDMGNWLWVGDDPLQAAAQLAHQVHYIHVKAAIPHQQHWRAVPLDEADNLWRDTLQHLPAHVPCGIEFPLQGDDLVAVTRHYVELLRQEQPQ
ncbi:xylose isomerase [Enterobacterales bacterium CwR94]|nr:xylose isomerase [Enterobacterales bacterium CwR94]